MTQTVIKGAGLLAYSRKTSFHATILPLGVPQEEENHMNRIFVIALASAALMPMAVLADGPQEIRTATTHSGLAAKAGDAAGVKMHLHHTVNCLVGPQGQGFDMSAGNPCNGQGAGAIPDTADAATKTKLQAAAAKARDSLALNDVGALQAAAGDVQKMLQ